MARVQYGALVTELKGSIAGSVFQGGNNSLVLRNKGYRKGTSSLLRTAANAGLIAQATRWRSLTAGQRATWEAMVANWPFIDSFGNSYIGTGYQVFNAYNSALVRMGELVVNTPSIPGVFTPLVGVDCGWALSSSYSVGFGGTTPNSQIINVFASAPMSPGRNTNNLKWKYVSQENSQLTDESNGPGEYVNIFGLPPVGAQVAFRVDVRAVDFPKLNQSVITSCIVTA